MARTTSESSNRSMDAGGDDDDWKCKAMELKEKRRIQEKKNRWREYNRAKQKLYVHQKRSELENLRREVADLEAILAQRRPDVPALSWEDVAVGLHDETQLVVSENRLLKQQRAAYVEFIKLMARSMEDTWHTIPQIFPMELPIFAVRKIALLASPESRHVGFDWLTHLVYQNTDLILERYPFTDAPDEFVIDDVNIDCLQYVWRSQRVVDCVSFEQVVAAVEKHVVSKISMAGLTPDEQRVSHMHTVPLDREVLQGTNISYSCATFGDDPVSNGSKLLFRRYYGPDRFIAAGQTITEDEAVPSSRSLYRKSLYWCIVDRTAPTCTRVRTVLLSSHSYTKNGQCVSLPQEARAWGLMLDERRIPEAEILPILLRHVRRNGAAVGATCVKLLDNMMGAILESSSSNVVESFYGFSKLAIRD
ncbi:hypothetical protein SPRG_17279 [Saprolegnia parasitica CBS 223.65]|uniref:BZIP domain-containing protein n=1 Tax=Saprolegnia parasitica (strain CBS 223.65) TaxID=695850 RepID=A0A067BKQ3_SAPPC|nr:hypothetical protein SPRG_17279 [Saprolegnia parasitica CBS 223.65]KDO17290.1 hypothetical protein SPRG_17279 [Saprolegnia parasitica CBS 223.65]|eukprot:XP_012212004.1 hypothetical protein SPRG_17279 [Saprolegnia parasitica CBS 223.65]